ncbi:tyrosine-type recombinase/integrase [Devosia psychrophila]|uniref:Integrase n=1 Tax=Devosia psychrophila TaxID=728005 RepID=A0A0F5PQV3_9HYPH|nr:tyrosine-type recombinase/integrase [Devosia psychrophila]KKC31037.1 integrase [Devosia psychrophila]SFD13802.1 Phage integrase family protein [Devosia psychrophila]
MVRANLKGVNTVRKTLAGGTVVLYYYHRATGRRLKGSLGSPEFVRDYADAEQTQVQKRKGTIVGLIRDYTLSPEFAKRAESTQKEYRRMLTKVEIQFGTMPLAVLEDPRVRSDFLKWRADIAISSGEREADNRLSVVSAMLSWGIDNGQVFSNQVSGFKRLHKVDRSEKLWLPEHIEAFMKVAPREMQRALILALHTGQRQGDLLKLVWTNYDGSRISLRQRKGAQRVTVPCTQALSRMLDGMERSAMVILSTKTGRPWAARYFKRQWEEASKAAGITELHFHDLRGTAVTMLAEAGCSVPEIASITGHTLKSVHGIIERYLARTATLATAAIEKFENASSTDFANRLQTTDRGEGKTTAKLFK